MDQKDNLRHKASIEEPWRYYLRGFFKTKWLKESSFFSSERQVEVGDPSYEALKHLLILEGLPAEGSRAEYTQMQQVRQFARYAMRCKGLLARERALLALAPHGKRLGVESPASEPEVAANGPELQSALQALVHAAEPLLTSKGRADATKRKNLEAAADLFASLEVDVDGGWLSLKAIAALAAVADLEREELRPLLDLGISLQKRLVALALASGLRDPEPYVRAAAARATYEVVGEAFLVDLLYSILGGGRLQRESVYGLQRESATEPDVFIAAYELVREHGLPSTKGLPALESRTERIEILQGILSVIYEDQIFSERHRSAAMLALSSAVPEGPGGLREEAWIEWWEAFAEQESELLKAELELREGSRP